MGRGAFWLTFGAVGVPLGSLLVNFWCRWWAFGVTFGVGAVPLAKQAPGYSRRISGEPIFYDFGCFLGAF